MKLSVRQRSTLGSTATRTVRAPIDAGEAQLARWLRDSSPLSTPEAPMHEEAHEESAQDEVREVHEAPPPPNSVEQRRDTEHSTWKDASTSDASTSDADASDTDASSSDADANSDRESDPRAAQRARWRELARLQRTRRRKERQVAQLRADIAALRAAERRLAPLLFVSEADGVW